MAAKKSRFVGDSRGISLVSNEELEKFRQARQEEIKLRAELQRETAKQEQLQAELDLITSPVKRQDT